MNLHLYKKTWLLLIKQYKYATMSIFATLLFIFSYGFFVKPILDQGISFLSLAITTMSERAVTLSTGTAFVDLLFSPAVQPYSVRAFLLFALALLVMGLLYCFFEGIAWYFAQKSVGKVPSVRTYVLAFTKQTVPWYVAFILYQVAYIMLLFVLTIGKPATPDTVSSPYLWILHIVFWLGIAYPCIVRYSLPLSGKYRLTETYTQAFQLPHFLFLLVLFALLYVINLMLYGLSFVNPILFLLAGFVLLLPLLVYGKLGFLLLAKT